jgi:glutamate-1-semialdehyde 2,1-aminomutase
MTTTGQRRVTARSERLFAEARRVIPGGVNSPVRAFTAVGGTPPFMARGSGSHIWDVDGNEYLDMVMSWGPLIHGHAFGPVVEAVTQAAASGTSFGAPTEAEVRLAEAIVEAVPSVESVRLVSSGTEATMSAVRLARAYTGRDLIVKFAGNYHGHADMLLAQAGSGALTLGVPSSPGVPRGAAESTLVATYNDVAGLERLFAARGHEIAAVIVEPIAGNMGVVSPAEGLMTALREVTLEAGALLILDEVISGFRVARGGAQAVLGVRPDLTTFGKIIGGGLPVGAYGGRREIMELMAPSGPVYQAGTLSGNPLATAAGRATLQYLDADAYAHLDALSARLARGLLETAERHRRSVAVNRVTGMLTVFFTDSPVVTLESAQRSDTEAYGRFFHAMLDRGISLPPSQFEAWMLSTAHTESEIDSVIAAADAAFSAM